MGRLGIVTTFEKAEETARIVVPFNVANIQNGGNTTAQFAATISQKRLRPVPLVERVPDIADHLFLVDSQRWNPVRIATVKRPREFQERFPLAAGGNRFHNDI